MSDGPLITINCLQMVHPSQGLNLITSSIEPIPHQRLLADGLILESASEMGLLDPVDGAAKTAKKGYEENQERKTLGEAGDVDNNYYQDVKTRD